MNILFHLSDICERGIPLSTILLAESNEVILHNQSYLACPKSRIYDDSILNRIMSRFGPSHVCLYKSQESLDAFILENDISWIYCQLHGKREPLPSTLRPVLVNAVFTTKYPFGAKYAPISPWLNHHNHTHYPVLPLLAPTFVKSGYSLRNRLGIPHDALVFGGLGGSLSFNIPFVRAAVMEVAQASTNTYFVFLNFEKFCDLPNVIFLPKNTDSEYKEHFINTCDAMLHARGDGETFGIACAEFSVLNRPIITWRPGIFYYCLFSTFYILRKIGLAKYLPITLFGVRPIDSYAKAHLEFLGSKAITYTTKSDLIQILANFSSHKIHSDYDCYSEQFSAHRVMKVFEKLITSDHNLGGN